MNSSTEGKMDMTQIMTMQMWLKTLIIETTKQRSTSLHDVKGVMGNKHRNKLRRIKIPLPCQLGMAIYFYCLSNKRAILNGGGVGG